MYIKRELSDFFYEVGYKLIEMKTTNKGANISIELQKIDNSQASNESLSVRDNEGKGKKCEFKDKCDDPKFECPYPMEDGEPDCW